MKTTIELPDALFRRAKTEAARRGISLRELFTAGLQQALRSDSDRIAAGLDRWVAQSREMGSKIAKAAVSGKSLRQILNEDRR